VDVNFTELSGSVLQKWNLTWDEFLGEFTWGCFLKLVGFPQQNPWGFPTKNDQHLGCVFWGTAILGNPPNGTGTSRQAARLPCLWAGLPGLKWKPFFSEQIVTKNIFKRKSHVGHLYSKHPCMMYFPTFTINEIL